MSYVSFEALRVMLDNFRHLPTVQHLAKKYKDAKEIINGGKSIIELNKDLLIEPTFIFSNSLKNTEVDQDTAKVLVNLFVAYYIQAFTMLVTIKKISVASALTYLSTAMESDNSVYVGLDLSSVPEDNKLISLNTITTEAGDMLNDVEVDNKVNLVLGKSFTVEAQINSISQSAVTGASGEIETTNSTVSRSVKIPIMVRAGIKYTDIKTIVVILDLKGKSKRLKSRFLDWRAGGIKFIKDLVFTSDLIQEYKKVRIKQGNKSSDDVIADISNRSNAVVSKFIKNGEVGYGGLYSAIVVTKDDSLEIEDALHGKLSNFATRELVFKSSMAMMLIVIDLEWERFVLYTRGIKHYSDMSIKDLKHVSDKQMDVLDLMKSFNAGMAPTL